MKYIVISFLLLLLLSALSLLLGQYEISLTTLGDYLSYKLGLGGSKDDFALVENILLNIRLPRILLAVLIGSALATSGAVFQAMFVNPLVSPGILGVLAGASFGAALGMLVSEHWLVVQILAFVFGFVAVGFAVLVGSMVGNSKIMLVLGGVISASLFTSLLSIIKYLADPYSTLPAIVYFLLGSLSMAELNGVLLIAVPMLFSIVFMISMGKYYDLLSLGDDEAKALGVNTTLIKALSILVATLASSLSVVMAGIIGWIGLIIPHIIRMAIGPSHKLLLPLSAIVGGIFLLLADSLSRVAFSVEVPLGILTSLIGIPIFIVVLKKGKSAWN
ncbi:MAG: iron ABC transporter permease [Sulfurimonadaceae bacterium]|nr:iron ABC transporter permease [Sulfurimonadaceae bacterium]